MLITLLFNLVVRGDFSGLDLLRLRRAKRTSAQGKDGVYGTILVIKAAV
jgi:hypothetical protein